MIVATVHPLAPAPSRQGRGRRRCATRPCTRCTAAIEQSPRRPGPRARSGATGRVGWRWLSALALACGLAGVLPLEPARAAEPVRIALLKFGTASWEQDVIERHRLDADEGIAIEPREYAGPQATLVALQAGEADLAITDWLWVARQRSERRPFSFVPYSTSIGALMVPGDSRIGSLAHLSGKRIGIAGGPLDKNWLLMRALGKRQGGKDPAASIEPVYGAPPLLNAQIEQGRLDGVITYWPYAARLRARGFEQVLDARQAIRSLGIGSDVPMIGYVFDERWADKHQATLRGFFRAVDRAKTLLATSAHEWDLVRPLMAAPDAASFAALREGYRAGIPERWGDAERQDAAKLFEVLREIGGRELVGQASSLPPGIFWDGVRY